MRAFPIPPSSLLSMLIHLKSTAKRDDYRCHARANASASGIDHAVRWGTTLIGALGMQDHEELEQQLSLGVHGSA